MDCRPVRWFGLRRPAVGTQVWGVQLGSSLTAVSTYLRILHIASILGRSGLLSLSKTVRSVL